MEHPTLRPGLRIFSQGILNCCRKLGFFTPASDEGEISQRRMLALTWLMDERHSFAEAKARAALGPEWLQSAELDEYEFATPAEMLSAAIAEMQRVNAEVQKITGTNPVEV